MNFEKTENGFIRRWGGETLRVEAYGANAFRVRGVMTHDLADTDYALLPPGKSDSQIKIYENRAEITNGKITVVAEESQWWGDSLCKLRFYNQHGVLLLEELNAGGALTLKSRRYKSILGGDFSITASFEAKPNEKFYGMGQYQNGMFDLKGCALELAQRNSQASVPFVLSNLGYGFFWHNPAVGRAVFGKNITEWHAESTKQLDYWITAGDAPSEIVENYAAVTGTVPMAPEYALGFWQCKLRYWNQEQLLETAREYKRRNLPLDVIVCDFFHWRKLGDFRFDEEFFPDPAAMTDELREMGVELMVSVWPQIDFTSEAYREMKSKGYLVHAEKGTEATMFVGGPSAPYDATNPEARKYVWEKVKENYYSHGIKIFWLDEAEPEYFGYDFENYRYQAGTNLQIGNLYPRLYCKGFYDGMTESGQKNVMNLARCAWAGSQRYGVLVWSGDIRSTFGDLKNQICAGLHAGIAGLPWWTTDIGGFTGGNPNDPAFRELLARWFQFGAFCPVMRLHGDREPRTRPL
ncbi:MAG: glycoside hydrolase family 31 protein, partial [Clostridiales bacterium]|nr:glycoside hydrolase family 31 protein [Clostridiales bacterium]